MNNIPDSVDPNDPSYMNLLSEDEYNLRISNWLTKIKESTNDEHLLYETTKLMQHCHTASVFFQAGTRRFVRARRNISLKHKYTKPSDLWHPPASIVGSGRANNKHQPVLYISNSTKVALTEIRVEAGDIVTVAHYKVKERQEINVMEIGVLGYCHDQFATELNTDVMNTLRACGYTEHGLNNFKRLRAFMRDEFLRDEKEPDAYKISSALVQGIYTSKGLDGVIYASKQSIEDWNIALTPAAARQKMKLTRCHKIFIESCDENGFLIRPMETSSFIGNKRINWSDKIDNTHHKV